MITITLHQRDMTDNAAARRISALLRQTLDDDLRRREGGPTLGLYSARFNVTTTPDAPARKARKARKARQ